MTASSQANPDLQGILGLAMRAAMAPAALILSGYRNPAVPIEIKPDGSPVTPFDKEAEQQIRAVLGSDPAHRWPVVGEEFGGEVGDAPYRWVVDPIDGTSPYTRGLPYFGTLIGFDEVATGRSLAGVIQCHAFSELYTAARGLGARCNGNPIAVAPRRELTDCMISVPEIQKFRLAGLADGYEELAGAVRYFRGNADCWMHAMAARGVVDAVVEFSLNRWDVSATEVLVEEAGGLFFSRPSRTTPRKVDVVFGSPAAAEQIIRLLGFEPS